MVVCIRICFMRILRLKIAGNYELFENDSMLGHVKIFLVGVAPGFARRRAGFPDRGVK